jgi:hypothetical protein
MSDACQCAVFCPCEFNEKPTFGHCDDTAVMHIEEGRFGDVPLDGQRLVVTFQSPSGERLFDTIGNLNFARIFVPEATTDEQVDALEQVAGRVFGASSPGHTASPRIRPSSACPWRSTSNRSATA